MNESTPKVRWAGIVFGTLFAALAAVALVVTLDADRLLELQEWWVPIGLSVSPVALAFALVLGLGAVTLVLATIALVRRRRRRPASAPDVPISPSREPNA